MKFFNQNGFSLIQVMIAAGMLGGLSLVLLKLGENQSKVHATAMLNNELAKADAMFVKFINTKKFCDNSFRLAKPGDYLDGLRINLLGDKYFAQSMQPFQGSKLIIEQMRILPIDEQNALASSGKVTGFDNDDSSSLERIMYLEVRFKKDDKRIVGGKDLIRYYDISAKVGTDKYIEVELIRDTDTKNVSNVLKIKDDMPSERVQAIKNSCKSLIDGVPNATTNAHTMTEMDVKKAIEAEGITDSLYNDEGAFKCTIFYENSRIQECNIKSGV